MDERSIAQYVTNLNEPVFALRNLPEEVVAVLFAYYSRSTGRLRDNLGKLVEDGDVAAGPGGTEEGDLPAARQKAREFHEKWVVGYGHSSVAEHAVVHLAIEDVSILASKVIEDARLASFTEKSTRYVVFDEDRYYTPHSLAGSDVYSAACRHLLGTYARLMPGIIERVKDRRPRTEKQSPRGWETACKAAACDVLRYLLPTATRTNIGMTANARTLEYLLSKMLSHPLEECRELGASMKREAEKIVPTLIKYAEVNPYLQHLAAPEARCGPAGRGQRADDACVRLVSAPDDPETDLVTALLYDRSREPWETLRARVAMMPAEERRGIIRRELDAPAGGGLRGPHDQAPRALEHLAYTFELTLDFGAFRDIQRHRMVSQTRQRLSTAWGYSVPSEIEEFDLLDAFNECMDRSADAYDILSAADPISAQYVLPLAWRVRVLFTWNLREIHHFVSLRSGRQGHASYRKVAQQVWRALHDRHPLMAEYIRVDMKDYGLARA